VRASSVAAKQPPPGYFLWKRVIDVVFSIILLIILSPALAVIALLIKLDSSGPVIFAQERVGSRRRATPEGYQWEIRRFCIYKFRTMYHNADQSLHQEHIRAYTQGQVKPSEETKSTKLTNDPRITRVGRTLRRTSLDELPQLLNVIKGDMSLVGPRPVPTYEFAGYEEKHRERMNALPGITGLWQIKGRGTVSFEEQIDMDIDYTRHQSLWLDTKLLLLTLPAILSGRGAG
jgi:lipopolysaccharide/colanic/teichoic acid biosynthesis glycosyltransferase